MNENINKVIYGETVLIDLTEDTVSPNRMYKGITAHAADGSITTGTAEITVEGTKLIMPEGLCTPIGDIDPDTDSWIRPSEWPDLSSVYNNEQNTLLMTVDATGRIPDPHVSICIQGAYTVQVGHIENNNFISEETYSQSSNSTWTKAWTATEGLYPIIKITGTSNLTYFGWREYTLPGTTAKYQTQFQAVVEIIGHITSMNDGARTPFFTEYEKIKVDGVTNSNALRYRWQNAYYLRELDLTDWNTTNWNIAHLSHTWSYCKSLVKIDNISELDTSNWIVTSLSNTWDYDHCIKELDLHKWDTSKWVVNGSMNGVWNNCYSLEKLDISTWDTSNWTITALSSTWGACRVLKELDLYNWDTSKWIVTNLQSTWNNCYVLKELNLHNWDTSKWIIPNLQSTWQACRNLRFLDISTWNTSSWTVTNLSTTWQNCNNLIELDLHNWDTSNWAVTNLSNTWDSCTKLKNLNISTWNTSNWNVTTLQYTWNGCFSLKELPISNWDTSNWTVTNLQATWNGCSLLKELPVSNWDTSNWVVTTAVNTFRSMNCLKELDIHNWDTSNWTLTDNSKYNPMFGYDTQLVNLNLSCFDLSKFYIYQNNGTSHSFDNLHLLQNLTFGSNNNNKLDATSAKPIIRFDWSPLLSRESILNIFNALKDGVTGKTCQMSSVNLNKMTADEKAIATNKGWTLT